MKIKKILSNRGVGCYLTLPAIAFCIAALCLYSKNGITSFNPELNKKAIAYVAVCLGLCAISLIVNFKQIRYVAYLFCLYAFMWFIYSQVTYIANVFVAIDGYTLSDGFIATTITYILSFVFTLISAILNDWKPWIKKEKKECRHDGKTFPKPPFKYFMA
jgi:hypothetical protein